MSELTNLTFFTNENGQTLQKRFIDLISGTKFFDILVGYFRLSGFYLLKDDFEKIDKIRILVGLNADNKTVEVVDNVHKQLKIFSDSETKENISQHIVEELYRTDNTYDIDNGILKFIEFLTSGKLEIRACNQDVHAKVYIFSKDPNDAWDSGRVITGSSNFSESGLNSRYEFNVELRNPDDYKYAKERFEELWKDSINLTQTYIDTIKNKTWLNDTITPYELYLKFIYEYFKEIIDIPEEEQKFDYLPKDFIDLEYQRKAVFELKKMVKDKNGAILADVVGLGKTIIVALLLQKVREKKIIICPPPIKKTWEDTIYDFGIQGAKVYSSGAIEDIIKDKNDYSYVIVDEAHRFRNENSIQYKHLSTICYGKKVILMTATPLNNSIYDFKPLITLFQSSKESTISGVPNLENYFKKKKAHLSKFKGTDEYFNEVKKVAKDVRNDVLKEILLRRTRTDIRNYFQNDIKLQNLKFPLVETPEKLGYCFDEATEDIFNRTIQNIKSMTFARYQPKNNLKDEFKESGFENQQEANLVGFVKTMLVKRLESSKFAFLQTVTRLIESHKLFISMFNKGTVYISRKVNIYDYLDDDKISDLLQKLDEDEKSRIYAVNEFEEDYLDKLKADLELLETIKSDWETVQVDFKKEQFLKCLKSYPMLNENKVIIFTESTETGLDLYDTLEKIYGNKVLFYSSGECRYENRSLSQKTVQNEIHRNFDPKYEDTSDDVQYLITTDVLAEGINLHRSNIIFNYDLPWNPTRVIQRIGRVNRVGTKYDKIHIFNFFPTALSDNEINFAENVKSKIQAFHETLGSDAQILTDEEEVTNHKMFSDKYFDTINNADTYNNDDESDSTLKYRKLIEDIQKNNPELFRKIKYLPLKSRTCRSFNVDENTVITFVKKDGADRIYKTEKGQSVLIPFVDAIKYFECNEDCPRLDITKEFYDLETINKLQFKEDVEIEGVKPTTRLTQNEKYVKNRIEFILQDGTLTDVQDEYLKLVLDRLEQGSISPYIKDIKSKIANVIEANRVYELIETALPDEYFQEQRENSIKKRVKQREVVLSEMLVRSEGC